MFRFLRRSWSGRGRLAGPLDSPSYLARMKVYHWGWLASSFAFQSRAVQSNWYNSFACENSLRTHRWIFSWRSSSSAQILHSSCLANWTTSSSWRRTPGTFYLTKSNLSLLQQTSHHPRCRSSEIVEKLPWTTCCHICILRHYWWVQNISCPIPYRRRGRAANSESRYSWNLRGRILHRLRIQISKPTWPSGSTNRPVFGSIVVWIPCYVDWLDGAGLFFRSSPRLSCTTNCSIATSRCFRYLLSKRRWWSWHQSFLPSACECPNHRCFDLLSA